MEGTTEKDLMNKEKVRKKLKKNIEVYVINCSLWWKHE
jgi:hypothetical protein